MTVRLAYPFPLSFMKMNTYFLMFCPPDVLDNSGRPVVEGRSINYQLDASSYRTCHYPDSRLFVDGKMNVASLAAYLDNKAAVLQLANGIAHRTSKTRSSQEAAIFWSAYCLHKAPIIYHIEGQLNEINSIAEEIAIASRICEGIISALMKIAGDKEFPNGICNSKNLFDYANNKGMLIGRREVCAAPEKIAVEFLQQLSIQKKPSCAVELNRLKKIQNFAVTYIEAEVAALIYETTRCVFWFNALNRPPVYTPKQLFAVPNCQYARGLATRQEPFSHVIFQRLYTRIEISSKPDLSEMLHLAKELCCASTAARAPCRAKLKNAYTKIIEKRRAFFEFDTAKFSALSVDIDTFFGEWP